MCQHHAPGRRAVSLAHGAAHDHDHSAWSRRDFLIRSGLGTAAALSLGATRAYALDGGGLLSHLAHVDTDRILVLIQLKGGNDGLNTVVPLGNDLYHAARPGLALTGADAFQIADGVGLHNGLSPLEAMWGEGQMAVVHSVGYDAPNLSHFASTDIWNTGRTAGQTEPPGGWGGRAMRLSYPDYEGGLPASPPAVQLGSQNPLLFQSGESDLSMMISSVDALNTIAAGGGLYDPDDVPPTPSGAELGYARAVANAANTYIGAVQDAATAGQNAAEYPDSGLGRDLAAIARLIKGGLESKMYVVSLGGFDTHVDQLVRHATLMTDLGGAVAAFYADLGAGGHAGRTLTMTFSEFGRRVAQNGSGGTDHGTAAPLFAFGPGVAGGLYGPTPDLGTLDGNGNLVATTDFRQTYASVLGPWMGVAAPDLAAVLGGTYGAVPFVGAPVGTSAPPQAALSLGAPWPNPSSGLTRLRLQVPPAASGRLAVLDALGREVRVLADGPLTSGEVAFDVSSLPAGAYTLRLTTPAGGAAQRLTVVR